MTLRTVAIEALFAAGLLVVGYAFGYQQRSKAADVQAVQADADAKAAELARAQADAIQAATNAMQAAGDTRARLAELAKNETHFNTLAQKVADYVRTHPDNDACTLGTDGLQAWREANAGHSLAPDVNQP
ncbi:hypothetical protein AB4076_10985 [Dyella sp. 2RAF44]|uniref:hypothetical protein n=1 Tax=Dyella sp. 2RAF44 TaxID=3233000 RepID=UPI003F90F588